MKHLWHNQCSRAWPTAVVLICLILTNCGLIAPQSLSLRSKNSAEEHIDKSENAGSTTNDHESASPTTNILQLTASADPELVLKIFGGSATSEDALKLAWKNREKTGKVAYYYNIFNDDKNFANIAPHLYNFQMSMQYIFPYALKTANWNIILDLIELANVADNRLNCSKNYWFFSGDYNQFPGFTDSNGTAVPAGWVQAKMPTNVCIWQSTDENRESILQSAQYLFMTSQMVRQLIPNLDSPAFLALKSSVQTKVRTFITRYTTIARSHYGRWVTDQRLYQVIGWGCMQAEKNIDFKNAAASEWTNHFTLGTYLDKLANKSIPMPAGLEYCNAMTDDVLLVAAGVSELVLAHDLDPSLVPLTSSEITAFSLIAKKALKLTYDPFDGRLRVTDLLNFNNQPVQGLNFDPGIWRSHDDFAYAGYMKDIFPLNPTQPDKNVAKQIGGTQISWDIAHAQRFVPFLKTFSDIQEHFIKNKDMSTRLFNKSEVATRLANQLTYKVFNGDFNKPLFTNYWSGDNGWYRVNYKKNGDGYAPWGISAAFMAGGYCQLISDMNDPSTAQPAVVNDLKNVCKALIILANATDDERKNFRDNFYNKRFFNNYQPSDLKSFLTSGSDSRASDALMNLHTSLLLGL